MSIQNIALLALCTRFLLLIFFGGNITLNQVCNLKRLGVDNYIIAAFDIETYRFAYSHGLPVFVGFSDGSSDTQFSKVMQNL